MSSVELRQAVSGDERILAYIQTESWKSAFSGILSSEELARCTNFKQAEEMYRHVLQERVVRMTIELVDGQPHCIAGWSQSRTDPEAHAAELICIHSLRDKWRKGYGSMMMAHILDEMRGPDILKSFCGCLKRTGRPDAFMKPMGFNAPIERIRRMAQWKSCISSGCSNKPIAFFRKYAMI